MALKTTPLPQSDPWDTGRGRLYLKGDAELDGRGNFREAVVPHRYRRQRRQAWGGVQGSGFRVQGAGFRVQGSVRLLFPTDIDVSADRPGVPFAVCQDRIRTGPPRARTQVIDVDLEY